MDGSQRTVDIHCHLLPAIDDGSRSWEETLEMAAMAVADGIGTVITTPHQLGAYTHTTGRDIRARVAQLQQVLVEHRIDLRVLPGADVRIDSDMLDRLRSGDCLSLADRRRHVLLELPHELYIPLEPALEGLRRMGMVGILSHPERNQGLLRQPEKIAPLVRSGCLMQVTADSLLGTFGDSPRRMAEWMVRQRLVHFLASDAHGPRSRRPLLSRAMRRVEELAGAEFARALCQANPAAVAKGADIPALPRPRGLFARLLQRRAA